MEGCGGYIVFVDDEGEFRIPPLVGNEDGERIVVRGQGSKIEVAVCAGGGREFAAGVSGVEFDNSAVYGSSGVVSEMPAPSAGKREGSRNPH
jgi:hypothetical protein